FHAEGGIRDFHVTGVQTCALAIFDEDLARIEQKLGIDVRSKGNQLTIRGEPTATEQARRALEQLYEYLQKGHELSPSDVAGALRSEERRVGKDCRSRCPRHDVT